jgi:hypothetical protein
MSSWERRDRRLGSLTSGIWKLPLAVFAVALGCSVVGLGVSGALAAPSDRGYELVSPPDKNGGEILPYTGRASVDGDAMYFSSMANFANPKGGSRVNGYVARRGAVNWATTPIIPWLEPMYLSNVAMGRGVSEDLGRAVTMSSAALTEDTPRGYNGGAVYNLFVHDNATGEYSLLTPRAPNDFMALFYQPYFWAGDADYSHLVLGGTHPLTDDAVPDQSNLYLWHDGEIELINRDENGDVLPGAGLGNQFGGQFSGVVQEAAGAVSADGSRIFFQQEGDLYVWEDGATTLISDAATFLRATRDGSKILFTQTSTLYLYDVATSSSTLIAPDIEGVVDMDADASHIYYATRPSDVEPSGVEIRLWTNGETELVATVAGTLDNSNAWSHQTIQARAASTDGSTLVFPSSVPLTGVDDTAPQAYYRYDAAKGELTCMSCPADAEPSGDTVINGWTFAESFATSPRLLSDDGARAYFTSPDPLVDEDMNGELDAYLWENGEARLLSSGTSSFPSYFLDASASGDNVFFVTSERLDVRDIDDAADVYNARLGGGFPAPPPGGADSGDCDGDACQGPASVSPALPSIGSIIFGGDGNVPSDRDPVKGSVGVSKLRSVAGSVARLRVRVSGAGRVIVRGRLVRPKSVRVSKAGSYLVRIALKPRARRALRKGKALKVNARVSYRATDGQPVSKTLSVRFKQPKFKRAKAKKGGR